MEVVFLYGPPGVGKLTVAQELAALTGYKVFHNHLTIELVCSLFAFGSEQANRLNTLFRLTMLREAALADLPGLISTFVYAYGKDEDYIEQAIAAVEEPGATLHLVLLRCDEATLLQRVQTESRAQYSKLRDPEYVRALNQQYALMTPYPNRPSLVIDTTTLSPQETARQIIDHLQSKRTTVS